MATPTATAFVASTTAVRALRVAAPVAAAAAAAATAVRRRPRWDAPPLAAAPSPAAHRRRLRLGRVAMASAAALPPTPSNAPPVDPVQYVVVRADLAVPPDAWPAGALMAQAVHAALAAAIAYADHPVTVAYTAQRGGVHQPGSLAAPPPPSPPPPPPPPPLSPSTTTSTGEGQSNVATAAADDGAADAVASQMHTVVLAAKGEAALEGLATKLEAAALDFVLWREQPEGVATALATRPYPRAEVRQYFRKLRLFSTPSPPSPPATLATPAVAAAPKTNGGG